MNFLSKKTNHILFSTVTPWSFRGKSELRKIILKHVFFGKEPDLTKGPRYATDALTGITIRGGLSQIM